MFPKTEKNLLDSLFFYLAKREKRLIRARKNKDNVVYYDTPTTLNSNMFKNKRRKIMLNKLPSMQIMDYLMYKPTKD